MQLYKKLFEEIILEECWIAYSNGKTDVATLFGFDAIVDIKQETWNGTKKKLENMYHFGPLTGHLRGKSRRGSL